ncbi:replication stress response regulator SDE2 [Leptopilina heterotoma]|uniref:replication stress response regulator SDE2 n=1 Tax=Leptopilina heterotoma TaxID=63436 RepID=UPI001CA9CD49|nr:replication stress response regulator SDE2 [Leptopilina heterotoma]
MLTVNVDAGDSLKAVFTSYDPLTVSQIWDQIEQTNGTICKGNFYIIYNGRLTSDTDILCSGSAIVKPRFFGGKGGFGSMLRAIGAQIEKTTNREACRDLSGRRLRDINEEKRLKIWLEKQSKSKDEASERKKRKLDKLCSEPKHEFKDQKYDNERSVLTERVADAVEEGFKAAASTSRLKRPSETEKAINKKKKITLGFGLDLDSDELESSEDDIREPQEEKQSVQEVNNDSDDESACNDKKSQLIENPEKNVSHEKLEIITKSVENEMEVDERKMNSKEVTTVEKTESIVTN